MAAGVQHDNIAFGDVLERGQHAVKVQPVLSIDVGIALDLETCGREHAEMIGPGRIRQPDRFAWQLGGDEIRGQTQRTGTTGGLRGAGALVGQHGTLGAKDHLQHVLAVLRIAVGADIGFGGFVVDELFFGGLDRAHDWRHAVFIAVNADTQIHLLGVGVILELLDQPENRVAGDSLNRFEHTSPCRVKGGQAA